LLLQISGADLACCRFATRYLYSTLGPPLRNEMNTRQITDPGHLWANVALSTIWEVTLEVFSHNGMFLDLQKHMFHIGLKHIDICPDASVCARVCRCVLTLIVSGP
jgi:hypothetical protein